VSAGKEQDIPLQRRNADVIASHSDILSRTAVSETSELSKPGVSMKTTRVFRSAGEKGIGLISTLAESNP
jgi:hypothetical protein